MTKSNGDPCTPNKLLQYLLAREGAPMFHFPLDSVSEAKVKHEPKTGKVVGAIMGGAIDVTVIVLLANADWGGYGNFFD